MLFAGFIGSACWSNNNLPTPYPLPFGSSVYSLISLGKDYDGSDTSSLALLLGTLLDGYQIRLLVEPPFHPALRIDD